MSVKLDSFSFYSLISFCYILFQSSDDKSLPLLEHEELDALLNGIHWDQPLSPLDLSLPTDPDIITFLSSSSSSPISPVVLTDQPSNPLVDKFLQSLTNTPIQFTDHPATSRQESRVKIFCIHCLAPTLNLIKPNQTNHTLIPLLRDDSL